MAQPDFTTPLTLAKSPNDQANFDVHINEANLMAHFSLD